MIFQFVIKGINGINDTDANNILFHEGIKCNWLRKVGAILPEDALAKLNDRNLKWHINHYKEYDPLTGESFDKNTPYISTTAGTVERDHLNRKNVIRSALEVALRFATDFYKSDGYLFYCYVMVLGKKAVELTSFAEEFRELNIYTRYSSYQPEGEITAKIHIPSIQIEKYQFYQISKVNEALRKGNEPEPVFTKDNNNYIDPETFSNVRGYLE